MKKVSIIGSGNVGVNSAFFIAEAASANVVLYSQEEGVGIGKALDMMEAAPLRSYRTWLRGTNDLADIAGSEVVVIASGLVRKPGRDRGAHFAENSDIVRECCKTIMQYAPDAKIIVVTEPVDACVLVALEETGFDRNRVMGVGGVLDSTRMAHFVAEKLGVSARDVVALVVGSHTPAMRPLPQYTRVSGVRIDQFMDQHAIDDIIAKTKAAGDVIVDLAKRSSSFYAPSAAIAEVVQAICIGTNNVLSVSIKLQGEYGHEGVAMSVPCKVGEDGVQEVLEIGLTDEDKQALATGAEHVRSFF